MRYVPVIQAILARYATPDFPRTKYIPFPPNNGPK
jgi:hypothetical protein